MKRRLARWLPGLAGAVAVLLVMSVVIYFVVDFIQSKPEAPKNLVQQITLIQPPPPPPPPKLEKPPEPEVEEEIEEPEPEEAPVEDVADATDDLPPLGEDLGLDAIGGAGGDLFGLVGKKGGRDLIGGGSSDRQFRWYTSQLQQELSDRLQDYVDIRKDSYMVVVEFWIAPNGTIKRFVMVKSSGRKELDEKLKLALADIQQLQEKPPDNLPQPVKLRISSRI